MTAQFQILNAPASGAAQTTTQKQRLQKSSTLTGILLASASVSACGSSGDTGSNTNQATTGNSNGNQTSTPIAFSDTAEGFDVNSQFTAVDGFRVDGFRVFTSGSVVPEIQSENYSLLFINAVADFNNDGKDDVLIDFADTLTVPRFLSSDGDGTFSETMPVSGYQNVRHIRNTEVVDLNGDGFLDVVAFTAPHGWHVGVLGSTWDGTESDVIFYNQGGTGFLGVAISGETYNHGGAVGDLNGDGVFEIFSLSEEPGVTAFSQDASYRGVLVRNSSGEYERSSNTLPTSFDNVVTSDIRIADLNGDGFDDLIVATSPLYNSGATPETASALGAFRVGLSNGTLDPEAYTWTTYGTHQMTAAEWTAFRNSFTANEVTGAYDATATMAGVSNIELIDINEDGVLDIVVGNYVQDNSGWVWSGFGIYINEDGNYVDRTSVFTPDQSGNRSTTDVTSAIWRIFKEDINGDGRGDLIIQNQTPEQYWQFAGEKSHTIYINEAGVYRPVDRRDIDVDSLMLFQGEPNSLNQVRVGDFNGDGVSDLLSNVVYGNFDEIRLITHLNAEIV